MLLGGTPGGSDGQIPWDSLDALVGVRRGALLRTSTPAATPTPYLLVNSTTKPTSGDWKRERVTGDSRWPSLSCRRREPKDFALMPVSRI